MSHVSWRTPSSPNSGRSMEINADHGPTGLQDSYSFEPFGPAPGLMPQALKRFFWQLAASGSNSTWGLVKRSKKWDDSRNPGWWFQYVQSCLAVHDDPQRVKNLMPTNLPGKLMGASRNDSGFSVLKEVKGTIYFSLKKNHPATKPLLNIAAFSMFPTTLWKTHTPMENSSIIKWRFQGGNQSTVISINRPLKQ